MKTFKAVLIILLGIAGRLSAHGPVFMGHYEAPGLGALDFHSAFHMTGKGGSEKEFEQGIGFGLTKTLSFEVEAPLYHEKKFHVDNLSIGLSWRPWNRDTSKGKESVVTNFHLNMPSAVNEQTGEQTLNYFVTGGVGHVLERRWWSLINDVSLARGDGGGHGHTEAPNAEGHADAGPSSNKSSIWTGAALGLRFLSLPRTRTDAMIFFLAEAKLDTDTIVYLSPQLLFQPNGRTLMKVAYRYPYAHPHIKGVTDDHSGLAHWAAEAEFRF